MGYLDDWTCPRCGAANDSFRSYCQGCNGRKLEMAEEMAAAAPATPPPAPGTSATAVPPPPLGAPGEPDAWSLPPPPGPPAKRRRWPWILAAIGLLVVLAGVAAVYFLGTEDPDARRDADALEAALLTESELGDGWVIPSPMVAVATRGGVEAIESDDPDPCVEGTPREDAEADLLESAGRAQVIQEISERAGDGSVGVTLVAFESAGSADALRDLYGDPAYLECARSFFEERFSGQLGGPVSVRVENRPTPIPGMVAYEYVFVAGGQEFRFHYLIGTEARATVHLYSVGGGIDAAEADRLLQSVLDKLELPAA